MHQFRGAKWTRSIHVSIALLFVSIFAGTNAAQSQDHEKQIDQIISKLTLSEKIALLSGSGVMETTGMEQAGIPIFHMSDGPMGVRIPQPSMAYPAGIGLAATWDRNLAQDIGKQIGRDARSRGVNYLLGPGVNIYRTPLDGRNFEFFGEDPYLAGQMAVGYIDGVQSQNVSATVKHFDANNSEYFRNTSDSIVSERALREIYLPAFEQAVRQGHVGALMDSYNLVNGEHSTQNSYLNVEVAEQDWGFNGVIMSDWNATHDGVAAAKAGLDLEMPFGLFMNDKNLLPAVKSGALKEAVIDDKIRRLLRVAYRFGWMKDDRMDIAIPRYNEQGRVAALQGAREAIVLLKNQGGILPLDPARMKTIAVIGPDAFPAIPTGGGSAQLRTFESVSSLQGISDFLGLNARVLYDPGVPTLASLAIRSRFTLTPDQLTPGLTVETFDNPQFTGKPVAVRTESIAISGENILDTPDIEEVVNSLTKEQWIHLTASSPTSRHYDRWTGYYMAGSASHFVVFVYDQQKYRLVIDGKTVIDHAVIPKSALAQTIIPLAAGPHKVVLEVLDKPDIGDPVIRFGIADESTIVRKAAIDMAKQADAALVFVGFDAETETEGADREFQLPVGQERLIEQVAAVNQKTIVVVTSGGSVKTAGWIDRVAGLLQGWYLGQEGGTAMAEVLFGKTDPSGRLPISWEKQLKDNPSIASYYPTPGTLTIPYKDGIFVGYRGYEHNHTEPLFPFGFGLSYTSFKYSALEIAPGSGEGSFNVSFDVTNTGDKPGADVAQVYVSEDHPEIARPPQELKGFSRVLLAPHQKRHVSISLNARSFAWYDVKASAWRADAGSFTVHVSRSSSDPQLEGKIVLDKPIVLPVKHSTSTKVTSSAVFRSDHLDRQPTTQ